MNYAEHEYRLNFRGDLRYSLANQGPVGPGRGDGWFEVESVAYDEANDRTIAFYKPLGWAK